jgi:hypothetical protein
LEKVDKYPLVTVVIPTYNRASLLEKAIDSALSQTYRNIEVIVADDSSTDGTKEMVLAIKDPRIKLLELKRTGHVSPTRNAGVRAGSGKWIAFLDSDDIWLPEKIECQVKKMQETGKRWCYSGFELMDESGRAIPPRAGHYVPLSGWITSQLLTHEAAAVICTVILERTLFEEVGEFNSEPTLHLCDFEFVLRVSRKAEAIALPGILTRILEHNGRTTRSLAAGYESAAVPYDIFLQWETDGGLRKIARRQKAVLLSEAAVRRSERKQYSVAILQLIRSATSDHWRHWCSAFYRSFRTLFKKSKPLSQ